MLQTNSKARLYGGLFVCVKSAYDCQQKTNFLFICLMTHYRPGGSHHFRSAASNTTSKRFLQRGDVVWAEVPQYLSSAENAALRQSKVRPFIVMDKMVSYMVDSRGALCEPLTMLGIGCTSKDFLVEGRPFMEIQMPQQAIPSYVFVDSLSHITCSSVKPAFRMPKPMMEELNSHLDATLQPESEFFLKRWFNGKFRPGEIWDFTAGPMRGRGMILLRRGRHVLSVEHQVTDRYSAFAPYLLALLGSVQDTTMTRGTPLQLMPAHEKSMTDYVGKMNNETIEAMLSNLRQRVGLPPMPYREPVFSSMLNMVNPFFPLRLRW